MTIKEKLEISKEIDACRSWNHPDATIKNTSPGKIPVITTTHRIINEDGTTEYFQLLNGSRNFVGTQHFFRPHSEDGCRALQKCALLVVDEIEDSLQSPR